MERKPLRHPVLYGEHDLTIDDKNRLLVPADIRKRMTPEVADDAFFLIVGLNRVPWLYPDRYYEDLVTRQAPDLTPGEELLAFDQMNFAMASRLEWDKQGRILIPDKTLKRTGLSRDITMIGVRDHLELWDREAWEAYRQTLMERSAEITLRARQARREDPGRASDQ